MLWVCLDCTTAYAVGVDHCPHCGSERRAEQGSAAAVLGLHARGRIEEDTMPKITRHGGASYEHEVPADGAGTALPPVEQEEGEQPSPGNSSSTSAEKQPSSPATSGTGRRKPAQTTGSRSPKGRTGSSTARSTGGPGQAEAPGEDQG